MSDNKDGKSSKLEKPLINFENDDFSTSNFLDHIEEPTRKKLSISLFLCQKKMRF